MQTDLLEKARVIRQASDERSFHIFYQLLGSMTPQMRQQYLLESVSTYRFLSNGTMETSGLDENPSFTETTEAMTIMGMTQDDQAGN